MMSIFFHGSPLTIFTDLSDTRTLEVKSNEYIYLPSQAPQHIFILLEGAVKVGSYASSGKEVMYDCLRPAEFFGDLQYLDETFFTEYAKALVDVQLMEVPVQLFKKQIMENKLLTAWFHEISIRRWCRAETRLFRIASEKPKDRIRHLFPLLQDQVIDIHGKSHSLMDLLSYQDVADLCGLSRQSAARILKELKQENKAVTLS
jgi:CRP-like cAMP-binding protein